MASGDQQAGQPWIPCTNHSRICGRTFGSRRSAPRCWRASRTCARMTLIAPFKRRPSGWMTPAGWGSMRVADRPYRHVWLSKVSVAGTRFWSSRQHRGLI